MEKTYSPHDIEKTCYQRWENNHYFDPAGDGEPFCIMLPPPNVTGSLHMGHGFQHTLIDTMIRYQRMQGRRTLWQPGTDHAGISTQMVVEGQLQQQGLSRQEMSRETFLNHVWQWKEQSGGTITQQMRRLGSSVAWSRERFTMDQPFCDAVQQVFIQLHDEGLIYRGSRLVNWDPVLCTAISDLEVIAEEERGQLWHIRYPLVDSDAFIVVATTRPETMLGDAAIAVHPDDSRFNHLIGQHVHLPLCDRTIPIIADTHVDPEFGTGCVKITPAHDFNDYAVGKRHQLPMLNILTKTGAINDQAPLAYQHLDRFEARKRIIADLAQHDLLAHIEPHQLKIPRGEKSNAIIEPFLTEQWYINIKPLAEPALAAAKDGRLEFIPATWEKTYEHWMNGIEDWCISRQLWWGHRIPAWYDEDGKAYVGQNEDEIRQKHQLPPACVLTQNDDVLDTWFSAALWPLVTLGWPKQPEEMQQFYPTSVLFTGFDIIFFWVARMVMFGLKFTGKIPFHQVFITGLVCDHEGKKMSKSKGNVIDPIDVIDGISLDDLIKKRTNHLMLQSAKQRIEEATRQQFPAGIMAFGADALRFTFCALATHSRTVRFDLSRVEGYRNFCNKLWNAARFVLTHAQSEQNEPSDGPLQHSHADRWIRSRLHHLIQQCRHHYDTYRFDLLANGLYEFVWHDYCDWYLELSKTVLYDTDALPALKRGTQYTLMLVLNNLLKLLHPIIPFITEEIWQRMPPMSDEHLETIMLSPFPMPHDEWVDLPLEDDMQWVQRVIQAVRTIRSEMNISPAKQIPVLLRNLTANNQTSLSMHQHTIMHLSRITHISVLTDDTTPPVSAFARVDGMDILIPMAELIDKHHELERLSKEMNKLKLEMLQAQSKLNNNAFTAKAPAEVVTKVQEKLNEAQNALEKAQAHYAKIEAL